MSKRVVKYLLLALVVVNIAVGCKRIPLYDLYTTVRLNLQLDLKMDTEIDLTVDAELDEDYLAKIVGECPQYVEVLFYDIHTHKLVHSKIMESDGGELDIPAGEYDMLIYSMGTESTQVDLLHNRTTAEAFTSDITRQMSSRFSQLQASNDPSNPSMRGYEDDPIIHEPDHLYVSRQPSVEIPAYVDMDESVTIYATASSILEIYSLEVINIKGAENIDIVEAFITGQVKSNYFGVGDKNLAAATLYTDMRVDTENNRLYSVFCTFGKQPGETNKIYLDITVKDTGGGQHRYIFDVTDQFDDPENTNHTLIVDGSEIDIPEGKAGGGGLDPSVDNWDEEVIDVPLG